MLMQFFSPSKPGGTTQSEDAENRKAKAQWQGREEAAEVAAWILPSNFRGRDAERSIAGQLGTTSDGQSLLNPSDESFSAQPLIRISLRQEFPQAVHAYDLSVAAMRSIMDSATQGNLNTAPATNVLENIISSLERNIDALPCLARVRQSDAYTYTHGINVAVSMAAFALGAGLEKNQIRAFALAGFLHDLGKALLPVSLLNARRKLSSTEQTLVKRHPMLGFELLAKRVDVHTYVLQATLEHHERYDGSGYPKGLSGEGISEIGHLVAIADTYDALSSRRPFQNPLHPHRSLGVMYQLRKKQFHPLLLERFVRLVGIYPVGSVVELKDGYRGVVSASNYENPMKPTVILALDPKGRAMHCHEFDLSKAEAADINRCLPPEISGLDPVQILAIPR